MAGNAGFISTRFEGTDGVSLESAKWAQVLWDFQYRSFWYAGYNDRSPECSRCIPEAHFLHPENVWINERIWGATRRTPLVTERIRAMAGYLCKTIYSFVEEFNLDVLIIQNALAIPMHIPLGVAITQFLAETQMPAIAHHHDFYWERSRFSVNTVAEYLEMAFPPRIPNLQHVVINAAAQEELSWRKGVSSVIIPNVFDFENPPPPPDAYASDVRAELNLTPDDIVILQPTRVVPRKGIEHAIKLVQQLKDPRCKLVVSHKAGDEGMDYRNMLSDMAEESGVDMRFVETRVGDTRVLDAEGRKIFTLWDLYPHADLVTYPSLYEGFGNAFLEAIYFRKPVLINRYAIFARDMEPKGFRGPVMDGMLSKSNVKEVQRILHDPEYRRELVDHNYAVALRYYSYAVLRHQLHTQITNIRGLET
ncbi:MAG: glycosyltransferase family 4 protein [Kiritimatiellae bacterium]|nr:glycosyltransferase family 4 protein [Kiritimatiellia bacterium]